jgi:hypothetical protein
MSALPLKADIRQREWHVRYVPEADIRELKLEPDIHPRSLLVL